MSILPRLSKKKFYVTITIIVMVTGLCGCGRTDTVRDCDYDICFDGYGFGYGYGEKGVVYSIEGVGHFFDAESGNSSVLCTKPDCKHMKSYFGYDSTCDAYWGSNVSGSFLYGDKLIYITCSDEDDDSHNVLLDKYLMESDIDGKNRRKLADLPNFEIVRDLSVKGNLLAIGYVRQSDPENINDVIVGRLEKDIAGVVLINLDTKEITNICQAEEYNAMFYGLSVTEDSVYYTLSYSTEKVEFTEQTDSYDYVGAMKKSLVTEIHRADIVSGEDIIIYKGNLANTFYYGKYIMVEEEGVFTFIKDGIEIGTYSPEELGITNNDYTCKCIYEGVLYMMYSDRAWCMDLNTGKIDKAFEEKLNGCGLRKISSICGSKVYFEMHEDKGYIQYVTDKDKFFTGDISGRIEVVLK